MTSVVDVAADAVDESPSLLNISERNHTYITTAELPKVPEPVEVEACPD